MSRAKRISPITIFLILLLLAYGAAADVPDPEESTGADPDPAELPVEHDEIVVVSKYSLLRDEPVATIALDRREIAELPHFGDDLYRAVSILPGTSANDISARFHVRGGLADETLVRLDGVELFEPFHLKDFQGVFSILDPEVIGGVDLYPGSFPAEYGDRMSGVLDMTTSVPSARRTSLGISFSNAWAGSAGTFADGKGRWLGSARRGYLDVILGFVDEEQGADPDEEQPKPKYWDVFAKLDRDLNSRHSLSLSLLAADDSLSFKEREIDETTDVDSGYGNTTIALSHLAIAGPRTVVETRASAARVDRDREGTGIEPNDFVGIEDRRQLDVFGLRQDWSRRLSDRHDLKWGFEARRLEASYDYQNTIEDSDAIDDPRFPPASRSTRFVRSLEGEQYALYAADRLRLGKRLTAEIGGRFDEVTLTDDREVSPRLNLVCELSPQSVLRAGWGRFHQSQRPHELEVEFGETELYPAQHADHLTLGFERQLSGGARLRVDAYHREVSDPRPRWETLFDPWSPFAETRPDAIRIAPERATADGVELYFKGRSRPKLDWWLSYALSSIDEKVDGRTQRRSIDQTHAVTLNANYRPGRKWNLSWVWTYHTGWPATAVAAELVRVGEDRWRIVHTIGPFYGERHPDYHRLDLRASRGFSVRKGRLALFLDVHNLYDRKNPRGLAIDEKTFVQQDDGRIAVLFDEETWLGIMPSFGFSWEF